MPGWDMGPASTEHLQLPLPIALCRSPWPQLQPHWIHAAAALRVPRLDARLARGPRVLNSSQARSPSTLTYSLTSFPHLTRCPPPFSRPMLQSPSCKHLQSRQPRLLIPCVSDTTAITQRQRLRTASGIASPGLSPTCNPPRRNTSKS